MFEYGRLRDRRIVVILCSLQVIVSIVLVWISIKLTEAHAYFIELRVFSWILALSLCVSGLFGLFGLCVEKSTVMKISKFLLIVVIVLLTTLSICMVFVAILLAGKQPVLLVWNAFIVFIIVAHIYATISASELVGAYRKRPIQPVPPEQKKIDEKVYESV